jgi:hypothetical protein
VAYNNLSGTVFLPDELVTRLTLASGSIISGNLDYSNGEKIINVPRISNAGDNRLVTNLNNDANTFTCESNLTFDGSTFTVTGDLTASAGVSGSSFRTGLAVLDSTHFSSSLNVSASAFYGDGSKLTGISAGGSSGGIFTEINSSKAYTTSSLQVGSTGTPAHTMSVEGTSLLSGAVDVDGHIVPVTGNIYDLGSADNPWRNLYVSSSTIYFGADQLSVADDNLKFGSGSTTKGFDVGFMNFKNNGIFMDPGRLFKLRAYQIQMFGGIGYVRRVVAADYIIQDTDYLVGIQSDTLSDSITLTLPDADGLLNGQTFVIKDEGGAVHTYPVTVSCTGSDTIDGKNEVILESPYSSISVYCNGINKYFIT